MTSALRRPAGFGHQDGYCVDLYYPSDDECPFLELEVEGCLTLFVVDSGCGDTCATLEQVRAWGLEDQIDEHGKVNARFMLGSVEYAETFSVLDDGIWNLMGTSMLRKHCCILDLDPVHPKLTFRTALEDSPAFEIRPYMMVNVAGQAVEVLLDTGASVFLSGSLAAATQLNLRLHASETDVAFTEHEETSSLVGQA